MHFVVFFLIIYFKLEQTTEQVLTTSTTAHYNTLQNPKTNNTD